MFSHWSSFVHVHSMSIYYVKKQKKKKKNKRIVCIYIVFFSFEHIYIHLRVTSLSMFVGESLYVSFLRLSSICIHFATSF